MADFETVLNGKGAASVTLRSTISIALAIALIGVGVAWGRSSKAAELLQNSHDRLAQVVANNSTQAAKTNERLAGIEAELKYLNEKLGVPTQ